MFFKNLCILVLLTIVASALEELQVKMDYRNNNLKFKIGTYMPMMDGRWQGLIVYSNNEKLFLCSQLVIPADVANYIIDRQCWQCQIWYHCGSASTYFWPQFIKTSQWWYYCRSGLNVLLNGPLWKGQLCKRVNTHLHKKFTSEVRSGHA